MPAQLQNIQEYKVLILLLFIKNAKWRILFFTPKKPIVSTT